MSQQRIIVLGLGNILFQDEGIGVRAADTIRAAGAFPENVEVLDGGTLGLDLLAYFQHDVKMIILDAVRSGKTPGSLVRLEGDQIPAALAQKMSMHQLGLQDLMAASRLRGSLPQKVVLWGMQPAEIDWGMELSPICAVAFPQFVEAAVHEIQSWLISH